MRNKGKWIAAAGTLLLSCLGLLLPGWLLQWQSRESMNMTDGVPAQYYSPANLAMARNASANLGIYQRLQLLTGEWESDPAVPDSYEQTLENYEAAELARESVEKLYQNKLYPVSLLTAYENWYSWDATFCKVVDATFHTYGAYYWRLVFTRYDGTERHVIYMLEDGTIFLAAMNSDYTLSDIPEKVSVTGMPKPGAGNDRLQPVVSLETREQKIRAWLSYAEPEAELLFTKDLDWLDLAVLSTEDPKQQYGVGQVLAGDRYILFLRPLIP